MIRAMAKVKESMAIRYDPEKDPLSNVRIAWLH
jgi:hypothetical protein